MEAKQFTEDIDFQKYWLILKRHWLPATTVFVLAVTLVTAMAFMKKPNYAAQGKLLLKKKNTTSSLVTGASEKIGQLESLNFLDSPLDTEAEIVRSTPLIQKTINKLKLKDDKGVPLQPEDLLKQLTVKGIKGTDILDVGIESKNPDEAAKIVNTLMEIYVANNITNNRAEAVAAREFITQQLPETEETVRKAEAALRSFKERNNIVALEEEANSAVRSIADLDSRFAQTQAQLEDATARSAALQGKIGLEPKQAMALNSLSQSDAVQQVLGEYRQVQDQLAIQRTRYQEQHPIIANLRRKEGALQELLRERVQQVVGRGETVTSENFQQMGELEQTLVADLVEAEVQRLGLSSQVAYLARARSAYIQRANILPRLQQGQRDLERQLEASQSAYQILLKNLQEVRIAENQNVGNARVIAYASVPDKPISARKLKVIGLGVAVGSMLYVITAFLFNLMDPSIKTAKEVRQLFRYTWLGMIPEWKKRRSLFRRKLEEVPELPVRDVPHAVISEAYRMLQANLKFLSPDKELKAIAVTSSVSKEGKSTVSANLALAMAQLGRRVLLIDADMRHPMQHHVWDLSNVVGLSDVIVNQTDFQTAVREVMENLDVLPAGVIPPNPLALLDSKRMASLIEDFSKQYDFIIIDTPPLVLVADALTLGKMTDGILLVVRPGVIDMVSAAASKEFLMQSGQDVLGIVVNGVRVENEPDSYFHHAKTYYKESTSTKALPAKASSNSGRS